MAHFFLNYLFFSPVDYINNWESYEKIFCSQRSVLKRCLTDMLEKGKINSGEFQVIVITFTIGSAILVAPAPMAAAAKQDAWIAAIFTLLITLLFIFVFN